MFTTTFFHDSPNWEQLKCLLTGEWINCGLLLRWNITQQRYTHGWISQALHWTEGIWCKTLFYILRDFIYIKFNINEIIFIWSSTASKSLQLCPTLCNPIDSSRPGSPVPGILQARTLEWVAISFSNAWKWKVKVKSLSRARLLATTWTAAYQAPLSMRLSRQEYWSGCHCLLHYMIETNIYTIYVHYIVHTYIILYIYSIPATIYSNRRDAEFSRVRVIALHVLLCPEHLSDVTYALNEFLLKTLLLASEYFPNLQVQTRPTDKGAPEPMPILSHLLLPLAKPYFLQKQPR